MFLARFKIQKCDQGWILPKRSQNRLGAGLLTGCQSGSESLDFLRLNECARAEFTSRAPPSLHRDGIPTAEALRVGVSRGLRNHLPLKHMDLRIPTHRDIHSKPRAQVHRFTRRGDYREPPCGRRHVRRKTPPGHAQTLRGLKAELRWRLDHHSRTEVRQKLHIPRMEHVFLARHPCAV